MINDKAYLNSINLLQKAITNKGFVAAITDVANYNRIWTRDGAICVIAAMLSKNKTLIAAAKSTVITIFNHQHKDGFIPSNVKVTTNEVSYGGVVGRADNPSWAVIALCFYTLYSNDNSLQEKYFRKVKKCFDLLDAWEFNGKHLIYTPQSGDWADEYIHHGYTLFNQLLRVWALQLAADVYNIKKFKEKAKKIVTVIEQNYWKQKSQVYYSENLKHLMPKKDSQYWLMGFNPSRVYDYFDLQANALALYLKIGTNQQQKSVIEFIKNNLKNKSLAISPSFFPTIENKDADMKDLKHNYAFEFRNKPGQFHNGGLWAVWNGLLVMALSKYQQNGLSKKITQNIHKANNLHNKFNECIDATILKPCGIDYCSWSAAGAIIAENSQTKN